MATQPNKSVKKPKVSQKRAKIVPRETIGEPKPTYVYRKDAFKKVKIT